MLAATPTGPSALQTPYAPINGAASAIAGGSAGHIHIP
jgi:hypothetical protein